MSIANGWMCISMLRNSSLIILCGGKSKRMGKDKAMLKWGKGTLLDSCMALGERAGFNQVLVSSNKHYVGIKCVPDILPDKGPLSGIYSCLLVSNNDDCMVIPVDMPLVNESILEIFYRSRFQTECAMLYSGDRIHRLPIRISKTSAGKLKQLLDNDCLSIKAISEVCSTEFIEYTGDTSLLSNINTPSDYYKIRRRIWNDLL